MIASCSQWCNGLLCIFCTVHAPASHVFGQSMFKPHVFLPHQECQSHRKAKGALTNSGLGCVGPRNRQFTLSAIPGHLLKKKTPVKAHSDGALIDASKTTALLEKNIEANTVPTGALKRLWNTVKGPTSKTETKAAKEALSHICSQDKKRRKRDIFDDF